MALELLGVSDKRTSPRNSSRRSWSRQASRRASSRHSSNSSSSRRRRSSYRHTARRSLSRQRSRPPDYATTRFTPSYTSRHSTSMGRMPTKSPARQTENMGNRRSQSHRRSTSRSLSRRSSIHTSPARRPSRSQSRSRHSTTSARVQPQGENEQAKIIPADGLSGTQWTENAIEREKTVPEHEVELQQELLNVLGARLESEKRTDSAIHKDVALRWSDIVKQGLPEEEVNRLLQKYPVPENCPFIAIPKLNAEINASVQENTIKRDKRIMEKQERIAGCLAAVGKAISIALKIENPQKIGLLELLSDGGRLLASIHREESLARKNLILANLNSSLKTTLTNTSVDEWLFGVDLEDKIKTAKSLEKTSKELKPPTKPLQQSNGQRRPKNTKGPPRQSAYKRRTMTSSGQRQTSSRTSETKKPYRRKELSRPYARRR